MKLLEERIQNDGVILGKDVLKIDSFLNHQMDANLFVEMGKEFLRLYNNCGVNKILTIESSGIGFSCITALQFNCPVLVAKKHVSRNLSGEMWSAQVESFTHGNTYTAVVSKAFLGPSDKVLILDDFLATGSALKGLLKIVEDSGAHLVGCGIAVEKAFQSGGDQIREKGIRIESLARIKSMSPESGIEFI